MRVLDLFAGPGGWSEGMASIGIRAVGFELDGDACRTRAAAGHLAAQTDVAAYPADAIGEVDGLVASPPCQAFSMAGQREGEKDLPALHSAISGSRSGWKDGTLDVEWHDARSPLILEPLRWAWHTRPAWIACEQVPPCLPIWEHMADVLRAWGYDAVAVRLLAADYGVPQTRRRAFLLAHRDGVKVAEPTHAEHPEPGLFGDRKPWVTMADALGWTGRLYGNQKPPHNGGRYHSVGCENPAQSVTSNVHLYRLVGNNSVAGEGRAERKGDKPAMTVGSRADLWRLRQGNQENATVWDIHEPSPTMLFGHRKNEVQWVRTRPATTVVSSFGQGKIAPPGHHDTSTYETDSVKITLAEAAVLQGFRPDYPFQGSKTSQFRQVGNAVPPTWAAQIIGVLAMEAQ